jgi:hypothetical protein
MGTRARVGIVRPDGSIISIYTHWDGYPAHHAPILLGHYDTPEKMGELLALGDLSVLAENIGEKQDFDDRDHRDWCKSYGRDRGEKDCKANLSPSTTAFEQSAHDCGAEYVYLLDGGGWIYSEVPMYATQSFHYGELKIPAPRPDTISDPY